MEVADNLESAARAVPQGVLQEGAAVQADTALKYLRSLLEGVQATERVLLKVRLTKLLSGCVVCMVVCLCCMHFNAPANSVRQGATCGLLASNIARTEGLVFGPCLEPCLA